MRRWVRARPNVRLRGELEPRRLVANLTAGLIVGFLAVVVTVSLGALIYSGELSAFRANGIGLALLSTLLIGLTVALTSSLPGMTASMQDAPAAILAVTALGLATSLPAGTPPEALFATVVATSSLTTLAVSAVFIAVGRFNLGRLVRYLPYPVVGGFLAGTGWLLVTGGLGVMADLPITVASLPALFDPGTWLRWVPGSIFALALVFVTGRVKHFLVWPGSILAAVSLFFVVMALSGTSIEASRSRGLLLGPLADAGGLPALGIAQLGPTDWPLVAAHAAGAATVIVISLMALLLNATGLELVTQRKVDLNRELRAAGIGNLLSGAIGGMAGYQGFSFTVLNHKIGTGSRVGALIASMVVLATLLFGADVLAFIPTMVVGGLVVFLGVALLIEWVYDTAFKLPTFEYGIVLLIVLVIAAVGFLEGVAVGLIAAVVLFVVNYSRAEVVKHALSGADYRSRVNRGRRERRYLQAHGEKLFILQLQGYIFFGTANAALERIEARLAVPPPVTYVILDFRQVTGLDATALLGFAKLVQLAERAAFTLVVTDLSATVSQHLERSRLQEAGGERLRVFGTLDEAVESCETALLAASEQARGPPPSFEERLTAFLGGGPQPSRMLAFFERLEVMPGHALMQQGDAPDVLYFVESGQVTARLEGEEHAPVRLETMRGGSVVGELGFYTGADRSASVIADEPSTVYRLTRERLEQMTQQDPELASTFHKLIVRLMAERVLHLVRVVEALLR
jgi:sulfate permease, SulP family